MDINESLIDLRRYPRRISTWGPFASEADAFRWAILAGTWPSRSALRRWRRGWYLLDRGAGTVHVGSKAFRRSLRP